MPLIHSPAKKPFEHNVKTELESGKPMKQALAIAYNTKRMAQKKMAKGGEVKPTLDESLTALNKAHSDLMAAAHDAMPKEPVKPMPMASSEAKGYADGGYVSDDDEAMELKPDLEDEDEISDELGPAKALSLDTYPDPDNTEHEIFPPLYSGANPNNPERLEDKRKGMLSKILADIRLRNVRGK